MNKNNVALRHKDIRVWALAILAIFIVLALMGHSESDHARFEANQGAMIMNNTGLVGGMMANYLFDHMGYTAWLVPLLLLQLALGQWLGAQKGWMKQTGLVVLMIMTVMPLNALYISNELSYFPNYTLSNGGIWGNQMALFCLNYCGAIGTTLLLVGMMAIWIQMMLDVSLIKTVNFVVRKVLQGVSVVCRSILQYIQTYFKKKKVLDKEFARTPIHQRGIAQHSMKMPKSLSQKKSSGKQLPLNLQPKTEDSKVVKETMISEPINVDEATKCLKVAKKTDLVNQEAQLTLGKNVERILLDFGFEVTVTEHFPGPVVTRFELSLRAGTKANKITAIAKDIARSLSVNSVRVVEVIPGKSVIGLEIPNEHREIVYLKELFDSQEYKESKATLPMTLGKDISGKGLTVDLAKMPHLLVAGTTGSGKSVGINVMILSLLLKRTPEQLKLILIDPKMLELAVYADIPHLLTPVVTDMNDAATALRWSVAEMERRYKLMAEVGVRNIANYNEKLKTLTPEEGQEAPKPMPHIVIVADEFADMFMVVGKKIEQLIARLAQKARAAGIHLILATQRPSVDVVTGLIKANIPSRISFHVSSKIDSRTVLDQQGAEQLLGHGDMLYLPSGSSAPTRVHGAYVSDDEVHSIVSMVKKQGTAEYCDDVISSKGDLPGFDGEKSGGQDRDPLFDEAVDIVAKTRKSSISYLQRRLRVGYNRAASLVEAMEEEGIIGPAEQNGVRQILVAEPKEDA